MCRIAHVSAFATLTAFISAFALLTVSSNSVAGSES
jgi:hypothetical protein